MSTNEENQEKVRNLMAQAEQIKLGGELKAGVYIDYTSDFGTVFKGNVIFKRPTMLDYMTMGARKSEYLRKAGVVSPLLVDNTVKFIAHVMATLSVVIDKAPEWLLAIEGVQEADILYHVFDQYEVWEKSFRKPTEGQVPPNSGTSEREKTLDS